MTTPSNHQIYKNQTVRIPNANTEALTDVELERRLKASIDDHLDNAFVMSLDLVLPVKHDDVTGEDEFQVSYTTVKGSKFSSS